MKCNQVSQLIISISEGRVRGQPEASESRITLGVDLNLTLLLALFSSPEPNAHHCVQWTSLFLK